MSEIQSTRNWFAETTQIPHGAEPNVRMVAFYLGMQCEELAEKLKQIVDGKDSDALDRVGKDFKSGIMDDFVADALRKPEKAKELLDGDADLLWVTIGAAAAQGSDLHGAYNNGVAAANWAKKWSDGTFHLNADGKVIKPEGWKAADLTQFIHPSLRA